MFLIYGKNELVKNLKESIQSLPFRLQPDPTCVAANGTLLLRRNEHPMWPCRKCGECIQESSFGRKGVQVGCESGSSNCLQWIWNQ